MSAILGVLLGAGATGGIAQGIGRVVSTIVRAIVSFFRWIANTVIRLGKWYFDFLQRKPEWGITLPVLLIYMFT
jgi:hypothetical protein